MPQTEPVDVWPIPEGGAVPEGVSLDALKYLSVLPRLAEAILRGEGTFSTHSPIGTVWVTISRQKPRG